jgi:hypothetical protein
MRKALFSVLTTAALVAMVPTVSAAQAVQPAAYRPGAQPTLAASLVIENFLRAVSSNDLETMGNLFGTTSGPISKRDEKNNVERRMYALATILKHQDYRIEGTEIVPGRSQVATQVNVWMVVNGRSVLVPWTLVRANGDNWMVEQIGIEAITSLR